MSSSAVAGIAFVALTAVQLDTHHLRSYIPKYPRSEPYKQADGLGLGVYQPRSDQIADSSHDDVHHKADFRGVRQSNPCCSSSKLYASFLRRSTGRWMSRFIPLRIAKTGRELSAGLVKKLPSYLIIDATPIPATVSIKPKVRRATMMCAPKSAIPFCVKRKAGARPLCNTP